MKIKETDLFPYLEDYFKVNSRNEIFTEVVDLEGGRPDIIVRSDKNIITIIELKTSLSMTLLEQAFNWRYKANYVYVAVPKPKRNSINQFVATILKDYGIGLFYIDIQNDTMDFDKDFPRRYFVKEKIEPQLFRNKSNINWNKSLKSIYKYTNNIKGGSIGKGYNTPYKMLVYSVKQYIKYRKNNKYTSIQELIDKLPIISTHYYNPKAGLYNALTKIEKDDFETKLINNKIHYRLKKEVYNKLKYKRI